MQKTRNPSSMVGKSRARKEKHGRMRLRKGGTERPGAKGAAVTRVDPDQGDGDGMGGAQNPAVWVRSTRVDFVLGFLGSRNFWDDPGRTASGSRPSCLGGMPKAAAPRGHNGGRQPRGCCRPATHPQPWFDVTGDADLQRVAPRRVRQGRLEALSGCVLFAS
jgi:hypothetical protein